MAYMSRLGIWGPGTPFREFSDFIQAVEKRGVGAMEIVAMDVKLRGMKMTRQLSFAGVTFDIKELPLSLDFIEMYNDSVKLWIEAREKFEQPTALMGADGRAKKTIWGQFWSEHQRFFKYLCIASKVDNVVDIAKEAIDHVKCVIVRRASVNWGSENT
ncbi:PREDICTED: protein strawberry notch homolog 1-like isoform X2 [Acropora digitifera]|uniref:protein strawberry notch homolog 1-like isoform X2 n=1 Tax=Acropora digitifera TaxID=70779 RepID=UPI00077A7D54|nr:PREDICTED: protein strawberry notch homolog 1-like isoform X2 [Acropora digitifera]